MAGHHAQVAANGVHLVRGDVDPQFFQVFQQGAASQLVNLVANCTNIFLARGVMLILYVAHNFLKHVLNGDQA